MLFRSGQVDQIVRHMENGILVEDDNNVDKIVDHILFLKNNRQEAQRMGVQARKDVERYYHWSRVAQDTEDILLKLVRTARS